MVEFTFVLSCISGFISIWVFIIILARHTGDIHLKGELTSLSEQLEVHRREIASCGAAIDALTEIQSMLAVKSADLASDLVPEEIEELLKNDSKRRI